MDNKDDIFGLHSDYGDIDGESGFYGSDMSEEDMELLEEIEDDLAALDEAQEELDRIDGIERESEFLNDEEIVSRAKRRKRHREDILWAKSFGEFLQDVESSINHDDYVLNPIQVQKCYFIIEFLNDLAKKYGGEIEPLKLQNPLFPGFINAKFKVFKIEGKDKERFIKNLDYVSVFSTNSRTDDYIDIELTVPDVFVPKDKSK